MFCKFENIILRKILIKNILPDLNLQHDQFLFSEIIRKTIDKINDYKT